MITDATRPHEWLTAVKVVSGVEKTGERQHLGTSIIYKMPAATEGERDREQNRISHSFLVVFFY